MKRLIGFLFYYLQQLLRNNSNSTSIEKLSKKSQFKSFMRQLRRCNFYKESNAQSLQELPSIKIKEFREKFAEFNTQHLDIETAKLAANGKMHLKNGLSAGFSTGTSGNERGIFLTNENERIQYIATILGKLFNPIELLQIRKIGLCLRAGNSLYSSGLSKRIDFRFFPLEIDRAKTARDIIDFAPDILIAPTQILIEIAKAKPLKLFKHVFYGAESMNDFEKAYIEKKLGLFIRPIYQATEGFLGVGCEKGNLHLNDDIIAIERKHLTNSRFVPIITDLNRKSQKVARLELDDILELRACDCGKKGQVIGRNIVRKSDLWKLDRIYFPDEIEILIMPHIRPQDDFIIIGSPNKIEIALENNASFDSISAALSKFGIPIVQIEYSSEMNFPKRRHIRWHE